MISSDDAAKKYYFQRVREQLRYWPHTLHQIDETLDIGLIEGKGRLLVYQALNTRNLTAFVGSGLSMAYGRMAWTDWRDEHLRIVERNTTLFLALTHAAMNRLDVIYKIINFPAPNAPDPLPEPIRDALDQPHRHAMWRWVDSVRMRVRAAEQHVKELNETFNRCKAGNDGFVGGDPTTVLFDVANQLHDAVESYAELFLDKESQPALRRGLKRRIWPGANVANNPGAVPVAADAALKALRPAADFHGCYLPFRRAYNDFHRAMTRPLARNSIEEQAKRLLSSECAHATSILRAGLLRGHHDLSLPEMKKWEALEQLLPFPEIDDLKRAFPGIRDNPDNYRTLAPFLRSSFANLRSLVAYPSGWDGIKIALDLAFPEPAKDNDRFLTPTLRFLVGAHLCLIDDPTSWLNVANEKAFPQLNKQHFTSRRSLIDEGLDPMERLIGGLGLRRFITTNYDFEIERAFLDRGFRRFPRHDPVEPRQPIPPPGPDDYAADAMGSTLRDQSFRRDRAAYLVGFGIGDPRSEAQVFHLHGRATREDRLVITERDYMDLYLMEDAHRETVNDGITMAFSGSPILFLGLGLTEMDLLRPLRQFMANRDRTLGFSAIALMPAFKSLENRTQFATSVYLRYGVHTVFYGGGLIKTEAAENAKPVASETVEPKDSGERSLDWLYRITQLIDGLKKYLNANSNGWDRDELFRKLMEQVGTVGDDLEGYADLEVPGTTPGQSRKYRPSALMVLLGTRKIGIDENKKSKHWVAQARKHLNSKPQLQLCTFTPVRRHNANEQSRHYDERTHVVAERYLGTPVRLLSAIMYLLLERTEPWKPDEKGQVAALTQMLDGLKGAIMTGALNAALEGIQRGWEVWWENWQESPPHRLARFEHVGEKGQQEPVVFMRHRVDNVLGPKRDSWDKPADPHFLVTADSSPHPEATTGVRSFDTFIAAIAENRERTPARRAPGRVMFTVLAHRGQGKGTFVSAFSSIRGLSMYEAALWGSQPTMSFSGRSRDSFLLAAVFINYGFSTEIASTFDMLLDTLIDCVSVLSRYSGESGTDLRKYLRLLQTRRDHKLKSTATLWAKTLRRDVADRLAKLPRQDALREAMLLLSEASKSCKCKDGQPRLLVCLSAIDVLYDHQNRVKNPEIAAWLDWLTGPDLAEMPIDLVFLGTETGLGHPFDAASGQADDQPRRIRLDRPGLTPKAEVYIRQRLAQGRLRLDEDGPNAAALAARLISGQADELPEFNRSQVNYVHVIRPFSVIGLMMDNFSILAVGLYLHKDAGALHSFSEAFKTQTKKGLETYKDKMDALWKQSELPEAKALLDTKVGVTTAVMNGLKESGLDFDTIVSQQIEQRATSRPNAWTKTHDWLRGIRHHLGYNRFLMTILLAAAQNNVVLSPNPIEGVAEAERFINATVDRARNASGSEIEEVVLRAVLESYKARHVIGEPEHDSELHGLVLRHLGVIGAPLAVDVLVRLPEFRDYFDRLGIDLPTSRRRFLARALTVMAHRGLVFRLGPHPRQVSLEAKPKPDSPEPEWPATEKHRYVLHRVIQRHVTARLQIASSDAVAAVSFAPSLYAAIPSPEAGLSTEGYNFVRALMIGLSQYPDIPRGDDRLRPWLFTTGQRNIRVQALRSAVTLARSTLSLPVYAALVGQTDAVLGQNKRGFLDTYKVRLRWLVRCAWETIDDRGSTRADPTEAESFPHLNALYRDEIVWLYNELGVISLAQGNLNEALGFLRLGREFNEEIEGPNRHGPIDDRLALNLAAIQIDRGRLGQAERDLKRLQRSGGPDSIVALIAEGYLCLIDEIRGRREGLIARFQTIDAKLEKRGEHRAQAMFLLHQARATHQLDPQVSSKLIEQAHALASSSAQEDMRNRIELSRVAIEWRTEHGVGTESDWSRRLIAVEIYGRRMGIWSLQVDALRLRAERLLKFGESASAGQLLVRAMAIAQRNSMMLRLNGSMTLYARALQLRGEVLAARDMAQDSMSLARRLGYSIEEARASRVLTAIVAQIDIDSLRQRRLPI